MVYRITAGLGSPVYLPVASFLLLNVMIARLFIAALLMPVNKSYIRVYYLGYWATFPAIASKYVKTYGIWYPRQPTYIRRLPTIHVCMLNEAYN